MGPQGVQGAGGAPAPPLPTIGLANHVTLWASASALTYDAGIYRSGSNLYASDFIIPSDERLKTNITDITNALSKVKSMRGVTYNWNGVAKLLGNRSEKTELGVIAQEVAEVVPEVVSNGKHDYKHVAYDRLVPVLIEAIKELSNKVEELEKRVN